MRSDDVRLYLSVMRAAAERVRHPNEQDVEAFRTTHAWSAAMDTASAMHARAPAPLDESVLERSSNFTGHMADLQVARERGIDIGRYQWIRDTIEGMAAPDAVRAACDDDCTAATSTSGRGSSGDRKALHLAVARDRRLIAPDLAEIRSLEKEVRAGDGPARSVR